MRQDISAVAVTVFRQEFRWRQCLVPSRQTAVDRTRWGRITATVVSIGRLGCGRLLLGVMSAAAYSLHMPNAEAAVAAFAKSWRRSVRHVSFGGRISRA
jgi:hypothetical protein